MKIFHRRANANISGIRFQLTYLSLFILFFFGILASGVSLVALNVLARTLTVQRNKTMIEVASLGLSQNLIRDLYPLEALAPHIPDPSVPSEKLDQILVDADPFLRRFSAGVIVLNRDGVATATTRNFEERLGIDYSFRDYFQTVVQTHQAAFSPVLHETPSGKDAVVIATPILNGTELKGVLVGIQFLEGNPWAEALLGFELQPGSDVFLIDHDGNIIFHNVSQKIGENISSDAQLLAIVQKGKITSQIYRSKSTGTDVIVTYAYLPRIEWGLILIEPWKSILSPSFPYQWALVIILLIGILGFIILQWNSLEQIAKPILQLSNRSQSILQGEPFAPLVPKGPREIRTLMKVFNQMIATTLQQKEALQRYARQILDSQEEERKRISRELHDETVQDIVGLGQRIELCRNELTRDPAGAQKRLDELSALTQTTLNDLRRMAHDLKPSILEDLGLVSAVQVLSEELAEALPAATVQYAVVGQERPLKPEIELTIYRIAQEAMTNIRKHASQASQVNVMLDFRPKAVFLQVQDNGPGFDYAASQNLHTKEHLGLEGMVERAQLFGGELIIDARCGAGTNVVLRI